MQEIEQARIKSILAYFLDNKESLKKITQEEICDVFSLVAQTMQENIDDELLEMGLKILYESCMFCDLDINDMWQIYWIITHEKILNCEVGLDIILEELYRHIFFSVREKMKKFDKIEQNDSNLIILVTSQMLGSYHAPTRRVLDYAYGISNAMGKRVMIINDSGLHYSWRPYFESIGWFFHYKSEYDNITEFAYKDKKFDFKQLAGEQPDIDCIKEALEEIYQLKPELVYNIGGSSLLADLCGMFTKTACFPCSTNIPVSMSQNLFVGRALTEEDSGRLGRLEPDQKVYETVVNYQMGESTLSYSRSQFGISEETFLIAVVGNRLAFEISSRFVEMLNQIIDKADVHFLVMGRDEGMENMNDTIKKKENVHFVGKVKDASQAIKLCDLYCNPLRVGGGRSSFEALAQGVPVVTLKYGDVYYTCGERFGVKNEEEYVDKVIYYVQHPEYRREMSEEARRRAAYLSDIGKTQSELLKKIL